jgi:hypothetical protein
MPYTAPPAKTSISDTYPNPSNAVARAGFGQLWEYVTGLLGLTGNPAAAQTALGLVIGTDVQPYNANTAFINVAQTFSGAQRGQITTLTDGATITPDFAVNNNFTVTLGGNRAMANPTNLIAGQSGSIFITQDGTGSRLLSWGSYWDFANGGTAPTLSTAANAVDRIDYIVRTTTSIHTVFTGNYS